VDGRQEWWVEGKRIK